MFRRILIGLPDIGCEDNSMIKIELEQSRLKCLFLFLQFPTRYFSLKVIEKTIKADKIAIRCGLEKLVMLGIIDEIVGKEKAIVYRYRYPEISTSSWGDMDENESSDYRGTH